MMNCEGINLNPQNFTIGINSAPLQIVTDAQQLIVDGKNGFGIIKPFLIKGIKDFPSFIRERFKRILGHPIPDNSKENLSIEEKTELANLKEAMRIILANNSDKMQTFIKSEEALKALWQVLTVEDSQNENIEQENTNNVIQEDVDVEQTDELDKTTKLVLDQLGMFPSDFKKIIYT